MDKRHSKRQRRYPFVVLNVYLSQLTRYEAEPTKGCMMKWAVFVQNCRCSCSLRLKGIFIPFQFIIFYVNELNETDVQIVIVLTRPITLEAQD